MLKHLQNNGVNYSNMAANKLKVQAFRANDLSNDTGKQFELGKSWCDFFEIDRSIGEVTFYLTFKPLSRNQENLKDRQIELQLSALTARDDRKAYSNGTRSGHSAIKEFFIEDLHLSLANNSRDYFAIYKVNESSYYLYYIPKLLHDNFLRFFETITPNVTINKASENGIREFKTLQKIFYGAPGAGKSNTIKREVDDKEKTNFRVTFHPDSDYSTFVGCYKPIMKENVISKNGVETKEEQIVYRFVPQAFTKAYTTAWNTTDEVYLIIEEINRGNCAQIFGDLFQLLDRKSGFSEYPIDADSDLGDYICEELKGSTRTDFPEGVKEGKKLVLPENLYIWATMNTSDQSLFPIDSAFKRRWDWKYMKIRNHPEENYKIKLSDKEYDWWEFIQRINEIIASMTSSADKQLGYFFCKATEGNNISPETFASKVIFYLWNDVFKDYGFEDESLFSYKEVVEGKEERKELTFPDFYDEDGEKVNEVRLKGFLDSVMNWKKDEESK